MKRNLLLGNYWMPILVEILFALLPTLQAQDYSFRVEISGEGDPVLLIPGLTCDGSVWDGTVETLAADYECHVLTLPGFAGQPAIAMENAYLPIVAEEIIQYIKAKQLTKPTIIGHSLGGFLALYIASKKPDLLEKMVIVDAYPFLAAIQNPAATSESMKPMAEKMKENYINQNDELYKSQLMVALNSMIATQDSIPVAMEWGMKSDRPTAAQAMYDLYTLDLREEIAKVKSPALVLGAWIAYEQYGVTREMTLNNLKSQYHKLANVQIKLSDKGKHFLMWDDPKFTNKEILRFLKGESAASGE